MSDKIEKSNKDITLLYSKLDKIVGDFSAALTVIRKRHNSALDEIAMMRKSLVSQDERIDKALKNLAQRNRIKFVLTKHQMEVYRLKCKGMTPKQISSELKVGIQTVYDTLARIKKKI